MRKYCTGRVARRSFLEKTLLSDGARWQMIQPWMPRTYNEFSLRLPFLSKRTAVRRKTFSWKRFNSQNCEKWPLASSCLSVCLAVSMKRLGSHWTDCDEICISWKSVDKIQDLLKSDNNNGYFTWRPIYVYDYIRRIILIMRNFRFSSCIFKVNHFYWPTNALNCIKLKGCINVLKDN